MSFDLDTIIFVSFLALNLGVGLFCSRGINTTTEYAIGNKSFSTAAITSSVVATYIGAGVLASALTESYKQGLYFIIPAISEPLTLITIGYFLVPKMLEFFGSLSVAETMGKLYGRPVRVITGLLGMFACLATVAMQYKVASSTIQIFFGVESFYVTVLSAIIITIYSCMGGIRAVTFTDILQFFTFGTIIPLICIAIWKDSSLSTVQLFHTLSNNPMFDFKEVLNTNNPRFFSLLFLFIFFTIPDLDPAIMQRVSMSKGIKQAQKSFMAASCIALSIVLILCWTGIMLLSNNPDLDPNHLLSYMIDNYTYNGLKGLAAAGIMAIIMSTADSYMNSATVLFNNDILKPFNLELAKPRNRLLLLRLVTIPMSAIAFIFAIKTDSIFELLLKSYSFYMPVITVPLLLSILGFRTRPGVVQMSMAAGTVSVIALYIIDSDINETVVGMLANFIVFMVGHLIYGKSDNESEQVSPTKSANFVFVSYIHLIIKQVQNFSIVNYCHSILPTNNTNFILIGLVSLISTFLNLYSIPEAVGELYSLELNIVFHTSLICSSIIILYSLLSVNLKHKNSIAILWAGAVLYSLIFLPILLILITNFCKYQIITFFLNICLLTFIIRWQGALITLITIGYLTMKSYEIFIEADTAITKSANSILQFKLLYLLLITCAVLIAFIKPRQEEQEKAVELKENLNERLEDQDKQILVLSNLKHVFLRNLQHETNTPITGVYSMSQALRDCYDKLTDKQRKDAINTIVTSSERLISYANNLIDVSKITNAGYRLNLRRVNVSNLLGECIRKCERLYIPVGAEEDRVFTIAIESNVTAMCDEYYIRKSFENLIINAIQYCKKGQINITLEKIEDNIKFSIKDSGIGIPEEDMTKIFDSFTTSTKTQTPAGGRGMGLTLVKAVAEIHKGTIEARSGNKDGSTFIMLMPQEQQATE